ncbi:MAG: CotH kinase family protein [Candidatus Cloacimonetes bacterium]|nr:CotH kinase family protein [Candidatus Cloacimonadota bacterium]
MKKKIFISLIIMTISITAFSQDFYDINTVNTIEIIFPESNWDDILDEFYMIGSEDRLIGTAIINGVQFDSVGVRYKGNSTCQPDRIKNPLNIKLDYVIDNQLLDNYGTLKLSNLFKDPSFVRETLSYEIGCKYMPVSQANYCNVFINGDLMGLYTNVQDVDKYFLRTHFNSDENANFKGEANIFGVYNIWGYLGQDSTSYFNIYELESDSGWSELMNFLDILNNDTENVENVLNVDRHLWMLAFDILMINLDSPINMNHNFYLYKDSSHRFNPILWDLNENFGAFAMIPNSPPLNLSDMQHLDLLFRMNDTDYPIINKIFTDQTYQKMYIAHLKTIIEENFSNNQYLDRALEIQEIIDEHVQADPNKFYSYDDFLNNLYEYVGYGSPAIVGITLLMEERISYLLNHSLFQEIPPMISNISYSPTVIEPNSTVWLLAEINDAETVTFNYRNNANEKFEKIEMFDDGVHNDGISGDEIYGASINAGYGDIQYYLYAENSGAGIFSPVRAEYEFHTIDVTCDSGDIVINEINYHSADDFDTDDWVEFYNPENEDFHLSGWIFKDENDSHIFTFPANTIIAADGYLVLSKDSEAFSALFPEIDNFLGGLEFGFSGGGELLRLFDSAEDLIDFVEYDDDEPWVTEPDGNGPTLELINHTLDNSLPSSWAASLEHGTPGLVNSTLSDSNNESINGINCELFPNYPNPFNPETTISFNLNQKSKIDLSIYNIKSQKVVTLVNDILIAGEHKIIWNGKDNRENIVSSGIYLYKLKTNGKTFLRKMILLK